MRTSRKVVTGLLAGAVILAIAIPGLMQVLAISSEDQIFNSNVAQIEIIGPDTSFGGKGDLPVADRVFNIFTNDGDAPRGEILLELEAIVWREVPPGTDFTQETAFTLDGTMTPPAAPNGPGVWTGLAPHTTGTECDDCDGPPGSSLFFGNVDLRRADSFRDCDDCLGLHSVVARAFAEVETTYTGYNNVSRATLGGITTADAIEVQLEIFENSDGDDNGVPDVTQLFSGDGATEPSSVGGTTVRTSWANMGSTTISTRGGIVPFVEIADTLTVGGGTLFINVEAPGLNSLVGTIEFDGAFTTGNPDVSRQDILDAAGAGLLEGVLVLSRSNSTASLTEGDNPSAAFDLDTDDPTGVFMIVTILLSISDGGMPATFTYLALDGLPDGGDRGFGEYGITLELDGDAIADNLEDAQTDMDEVFAYRFPTDVTVDVEDLLNTTPEDGVWNDVEADGSQVSFGEFARTAVPVAPAVVDSMTVFLTTGSGIIGTSVTPRAGGAVGGGGSDGICFIATAAYGTPLADEIGVLRGLRDSYMLNNMVGTAFVDTYYRLSPPVADVVAHNAVAKALVRTLLVPVLMLSGFALAMPGASAAMLLAALAFAGYRVRKSVTRS